jgi:hypothetical protein
MRCANAQHQHVVAAGEEFDPPIVAGNAVQLVLLVAPERKLGIPLREASGQGAAGVFSDQILDVRQTRVIVRMEVHADRSRGMNLLGHRRGDCGTGLSTFYTVQR